MVKPTVFNMKALFEVLNLTYASNKNRIIFSSEENKQGLNPQCFISERKTSSFKPLNQWH